MLFCDEPMIKLRITDWSRRFVLLVVISLTVACATAPPVQEMSDARQAIAAAREAGAEEFAGEQLQKAESLLQDAESLLVAGNSNTYWQAKKAAVDSKNTAFEALLRSRNQTSPVQ